MKQGSSLYSLIKQLGEKQIQIWVENESLKYKAPKGKMDAELKNELIHYKKELIAFLKEQSEKQGTIETRPDKNHYPLSHAQQRLWFIEQYKSHAQGATYNIPIALRMYGALDIAALNKAINSLVQRHEVLQTFFVNEKGFPRQLKVDNPYCEVEIKDLSHMNRDDQEFYSEQEIEENIATAFDLSKWPLFKLDLIKCSDSYIFLATMHHIIADGWSLDILVREIAYYYTCFLEGRDADLPDLELQYADYAYWQNQWMSESRIEKQLGFWKEYLKDSSVLELPLDKVRKDQDQARGAHKKIVLPHSLQNKLNSYANKQGVTLFMLLLSGFNILMARFSQQDDISLGIPVANRNRPEWEPLIGFFVNTLVLRSDLSGDPLFSDLLKQVQENTLAIYSNQDLPFDKLVEVLVKDRDTGFSPLFQVMFSLQNTPGEQSIKLPGLKISTMENAINSARNDMTWNLCETENGISLDIEYRSDLFLEQTIDLYAKYYPFLMEQLIDLPDQGISHYLFQSPRETLQQALTFNPPPITYPDKKYITQLFDECVLQYPERPAISHDGLTLDYSELNRAVNGLASVFQKAGISENTFVLIALERSIEMVEAQLAVLKLGACCVPLDPEYPDDRKQYIKQDSKAQYIVSIKALLPALECLKDDTVKIICVDEALEAQKHETTSDVSVALSLKNHELPAYVFYTSGSTGQPKGVVAPHKAVVRLVKNTNFADFGPDEVVAHLSNVSFDAASMEIWGALLNGGHLEILDKDTVTSAYNFDQVLNKTGISIMFITTALFKVLAHEKPGMFGGLKTLLVGGEMLDLNALEKMFNSASTPKRFLNVYGPTENTTFSTFYCIENMPENVVTVPIGKSINHSQIYNVDRHGHLLPPGLTGELVCAGDGLALGYLNKEELSAEKFVSAYIKELPETRVYLTGDLGRLSPEGNIYICGRRDEQVKIRGFRIEPSEVERVLENIPGIEKSVVVALERTAELGKALVAYVVLSKDKTLKVDLNIIRQKVKELLPVYMQPMLYQEISFVPINANGKVDKKALPEADWSLLSTVSFQPPRSPLETALCEIWSELLDMEKVGIGDNFFELGGHSLLATRMVSRIQQSLGVNISVKQVFDHPSIASLAIFLEEQNLLADSALTALPDIVPCNHDGLHPLSKAQQRLWFIHQMNPESSAYGMPMAIRINGDLDIQAFKKAVEALVRRHESLRTRFLMDADKVKQKLVEAHEAYQFHFRENIDAQSLKAAIDENENRSFDLEQGPLFYVELLQVAKNSYVLLMNMHHIISDGWSMQILQKDLLSLYQGEELVSLDVQYIDYVYWQQKILDEAEQKRLLDYWLGELEGVGEILHVPSDRPRPEQQSFQGAVYRHHLDEKTQKQALQFCQQQGISSFVLGITCYALLLSKYSQQDDFCIGIPVAGREHHALENLIGFFVNGIVIRSDLRNRLKVTELLEQFRNKSLTAFRHQQLSADVLIDAMGIRPNAKYQPLAQVAFSHQHIDNKLGEQNGDLQVEILPSENHSAKYDLMFSLGDDGESLTLVCEYASDLFDESTIATLMQHYETLLGKMISDSDAMVDTLDWYSDEEILSELEHQGRTYQKIYPLTLNQQAIYFDALINPESKQNAIANFLDINIHIDLEQWRKAFSLIQQAHDVFRSDIINVDLPGHHRVYQAVAAKPVQLDLHYEDWSAEKLDFTSACQKLEAAAYCKYDIEKDALYHYSLYKLGEEHYLAMLRAHHLLFDGVSGKVFLEEMSQVYQALQEGKAPEFLEEQFETFVHRNLAQSDSKACLDFWQDKCSSLGALSFDSLPNRNNNRYRQKQLVIDEQSTVALRQFCRRQGLTPALFFKCLYAALIQSYCRCDEDFYLLEYHHGRGRSESNSYGVYYQQNPFIVDHDLFSAGESLQQHLHNLFAYARQFQKDSRHYRDFSIQAQAQVLPQSNIGFMYNYTQFESEINLLGQPQSSLFLSPRAEKHVQLFVRERQQDFELLLLFGEDYFSDYQMLQRMQSLMKSVLQGEASLLLAQDWQQLEQLNHAFQKTEPSSEKLLSRFQQAAQQKGERTAVQVYHQDTSSLLHLSYQQLAQQSRALVDKLTREHAIGKDSRVGIYCESNATFFVALFAVIETGASYIPISVKLPCERVKDILSDAQSNLVLTQSSLIEKLDDIPAQVLALDAWLDQADYLEHDKGVVEGPGHDETDCLYTIFTSGSTGRPKGAMVSHRGEVNLLDWYENTLAINDKDCSLIISDPGFDLTQKNFFAFLRNGARVLLTGNSLFDVEAIRGLVEQYQVTHINCAPSTFYALLDGGESSWQALQSLRWVVLGGEAIVRDALRDWYQSPWRKAKVMNSYGPTECSDVVCAYVLQDEDFSNANEAASIPLGRAIDNAELYVLDNHQRITAAGLVGEIAIGGDCLGLGYIAQARLNQEKFISIETGHGRREVYLSGDLGRINDKGQLEYIGRKDFQVKLRGQRIELEEIAHALRRQAQIQDALVLLRDGHLVAYVIGKEAMEQQSVLKELAKVLPAYMLPQTIMVLKQWPLNNNGKVDRNALPEPTFERSKAFIAPRNATEQVLAEIWCELLALPEVSVQDSFFELGGHSLLASRAVSRLKEHFRVEFPLKALFDLHTIADIAEYIDGLKWALESREKQNQANQEENREEGFL